VEELETVRAETDELPKVEGTFELARSASAFTVWVRDFTTCFFQVASGSGQGQFVLIHFPSFNNHPYLKEPPKKGN